MRTLWLVVPDHVLAECGCNGRLDQSRACKTFSTKVSAFYEAKRQAADQNWPVHVLEASVIQVFPAEQEAAAKPEIESRYSGVTLRGKAAKRFLEQIGELPAEQEATAE